MKFVSFSLCLIVIPMSLVSSIWQGKPVLTSVPGVALVDNFYGINRTENDYCNAAIISDIYGITLAKCCIDDHYPKYVFVGSKPFSIDAQMRFIKTMHLVGKIEMNPVLCVFRLNQPLKLSTNFVPINLASESDKANWKTSEMEFFSFGPSHGKRKQNSRLSDPFMSDVLRKDRMSIIDDPQEEIRLCSHYSELNVVEGFCSEATQPPRSFLFDQGSPVIEKGSNILYGIVVAKPTPHNSKNQHYFVIDIKSILSEIMGTIARDVVDEDDYD